MFPRLFNIPLLNIPIYTYSLMIIIGYLLASYISFINAKRLGLYSNDVLDFVFWALFSGIIGSRIMYVLIEWRKFFITSAWVKLNNFNFHIPSVFAFWEGGLVIWGGILGGIVAFLLFVYKRQINLYIFADILVLGIPLAQSLGRVGCFFAGCCWGKAYYHLNLSGNVVSNFPLCIQFPNHSLAYEFLFIKSNYLECKLMYESGLTLPLFPIQLCESVIMIVIFFILLYLYSSKKFHGKILFYYFILYSISRVFLEIFRGDLDRGFVINGIFSINQLISLLVLFIALYSIVIFKDNKI